MIDVRGLYKLYGGQPAVEDLSFSLPAGQICALVGPNGAGKTTTMRCLAGLIPPSSGRLRIAGCDLTEDLIEVKRRLAYVPDDPPLFDDLSVGEHLSLIGRLYRIADYRTRAAEWLDHFQLLDKHDAGATTLSRGMRQKLAICCAHLIRPRVLLLDEPLTGLDPPAIRRLLESVRWAADRGATVVISSHLLAMIEDVCSHLLVMQAGRAQYFGEAKQLRQRYPEARGLEEAFFAATADHAAAPIDRVAPTATVLPARENPPLSEPACGQCVSEPVCGEPEVARPGEAAT